MGRRPSERPGGARSARQTRAAKRGRRQAYRRRRVAAIGALVVAALALLLVVPALGTDTRGARVVRFSISGALVHATLPVAAVIPAGTAARPRPLLVFLHGKGEDQDSNLDDAMFAALARLGSRAPDVVFPYGGADSYWHNGRTGRGVPTSSASSSPRR